MVDLIVRHKILNPEFAGKSAQDAETSHGGVLAEC